ncbi:class A sortase [Rummeliibacillus suwonensis]|uniref:class A sortase n=1 Tax=Rummeliibacillus suwonensis TaxID=1306154 RepID=UPI00164470FD|nr:class A sortase [Rummeliibacillus suwonensis]
MIRKLWLVLGILFLFIGFVFIFQKPIMGYLVDNMSEETIQKSNMKEIETSPDTTFDFKKVKNISLQDVINAQTKKKDVHAIGAISVPDVHLQLPIVYGISNINLTIGAGTMKRDQVMGQGNYALAGHNMNNGKTLFSPLTKAKKGMMVYITDFKNIYEYQISTMFIVTPTQVEVIEDQQDEKLLTLVTCNYNGEKRMIIRGKLINKQAYTDDTKYFKISK